MPRGDPAPGPASGLEGVRRRQLPPVGEDERGAGLDGRAIGLGEQEGEPEAVRALVSVLAGEVGEVVLGVRRGVLRARGAAGALAARSAAAVVGRVRDHSIHAVVGDAGEGGQRVTSVRVVRHCAVLSFGEAGMRAFLRSRRATHVVIGCAAQLQKQL